MIKYGAIDVSFVNLMVNWAGHVYSGSFFFLCGSVVVVVFFVIGFPFFSSFSILYMQIKFYVLGSLRSHNLDNVTPDTRGDTLTST